MQAKAKAAVAKAEALEAESLKALVAKAAVELETFRHDKELIALQLRLRLQYNSNTIM